jgi:predicted nucleic acid-binding protein
VIVVDTSIVASWFFSDEGDEMPPRSAERVLAETAMVPPIFPAELGNALLFACRKGRIPRDEIDAAFERIRQLPIRIESQGLDLKREIALATRYDLTIYDAMYLALADRHRIALLTRDRVLHAAALEAGLAGGEL